LQAERHVADFIEEQRAAIGCIKQTLMVAISAAESALGAVTGRPRRAGKARAAACPETRTPMVSPPAVSAGGSPSRAGNTSVSGPGQKRAASRCACGDTSRTTAAAIAVSASRTRIGLPISRPRTSTRRRTATSLSASAPRP
jgi:hypothetical protein